jgi:hypothetical protein
MSRKLKALARITKQMAYHQRRWAVLLKRKDRVQKLERWK